MRHRKKAFLSAPGSLTLEAVMCLTLFIFAAVCLILPMKIMNTERKMQAALEKIGEDCSQYAYVADALDKGKLSVVAGAGDFAKGFCRHLASGAAKGYAQAQMEDHIDTLAEDLNIKKNELLKKLKEYRFLYLTDSSEGYQTCIRFKPCGEFFPKTYTQWCYCILKLDYLAKKRLQRTNK